MAWKDDKWLCLDVETTGLSPATEKVVELGAVSFQNGELLIANNYRINPGIPIPDEVAAIHGIHDVDVANEPKFSDYEPLIMSQIMSHPVLVAYNWPFDAAFLAMELGAKWHAAIRGKVIIDPLTVVRVVGKFWKGKGRHKLGNAATKLGIETGELHRAVEDCRVTCLILDKLKEYLPDDGAEASNYINTMRGVQKKEYEEWRKSLRK
jgi:DNA polymerase III epsilon subunit family exonuclease